MKKAKFKVGDKVILDMNFDFLKFISSSNHYKEDFLHVYGNGPYTITKISEGEEPSPIDHPDYRCYLDGRHFVHPVDYFILCVEK